MKLKSKSAKQSWQNNEDVQEEVKEVDKEEQVEDAPWQEILLNCRVSGGQLELG